MFKSIAFWLIAAYALVSSPASAQRLAPAGTLAAYSGTMNLDRGGTSAWLCQLTITIQTSDNSWGQGDLVSASSGGNPNCDQLTLSQYGTYSLYSSSTTGGQGTISLQFFANGSVYCSGSITFTYVNPAGSARAKIQMVNASFGNCRITADLNQTTCPDIMAVSGVLLAPQANDRRKEN